MQWDIGLDLGSSRFRVALRGQGVVLDEPSLAATRQGALLARGNAALSMLGRTPKDVVVDYPIRNGVPMRRELLAPLVRDLIEQVGAARWRRKPNLLIANDGLMGPDDLRALLHAAVEGGGGEMGLLDADLAACIGAELDVFAPKGWLVLNLGAGHISAFLAAGGYIVRRERLPFGCDELVGSIRRTVRARAGLLIGDHTAREILSQLGSALGERGDLHYEAAGIDLKTGFPCSMRISQKEIAGALSGVPELIVNLADQTLSLAPSELCADLSQNGILLTGGGAQLFGLDVRLQNALELPCRAANDPALCVARGLYQTMTTERLGGLITRPAP